MQPDEAGHQAIDLVGVFHFLSFRAKVGTGVFGVQFGYLGWLRAKTMLLSLDERRRGWCIKDPSLDKV
jgi:hypothetical protein